MTHSSSNAANVAAAFVAARLSACTFDTYPGVMPQTLEAAYAMQDAALAMWPLPVRGWKVGRIMGADAVRFGCDRLAGPIFPNACFTASDSPLEMPVFEGGFAAVEGECVIVVGSDAPADKVLWSTSEAMEMIGAIHAGVEIASSPFSGINDHGPLVTISDFGNNYGLILGDEIPGWRAFKPKDWAFETYIDGSRVGSNHAGDIPGGPVESLRFMLENAAARGIPLKKGMFISTGAVTGVHVANAGQSAIVKANGVQDIALTLVAAKPELANVEPTEAS